MAALPTGKHFDLTESQKELLKKLQEALVCCDPLTQGTCSWSKFASNVRWPTLSFSCQKQEFRKWLITNFASASYSFTAEELNRLIVIIFEEYARQRKVEEMPLSWRYINHEARLNLEKDVFGERERAHEQWALLSNARGVCPNCGAHSLTRPFEHCNTSATCFEHCFRGLLQLHWHFTNHVCSAPEAWYALDDSLL